MICKKKVLFPFFCHFLQGRVAERENKGEIHTNFMKRETHSGGDVDRSEMAESTWSRSLEIRLTRGWLNLGGSHWYITRPLRRQIVQNDKLWISGLCAKKT